MSIYHFDPVQEAAFRNIVSSIDAWGDHAAIPAQLLDDAHELYRKALSVSRFGYMYDPTQVQLVRSYAGCSIQFWRHQPSMDLITFHSSVEFEIDFILSEAKKRSTQYEQILFIYKYFVEQFHYESEHPEMVTYHTGYSPFIFRSSVCDGFALAFSILLNRLGVSCGIVTGMGRMNQEKPLSHVWNIVMLGNAYYHFDVTWDICLNHNKVPYHFEFFCRERRAFSRDHEWSDHMNHSESEQPNSNERRRKS